MYAILVIIENRPVTHCVSAVKTFFKIQSIMHMERILGLEFDVQNSNCCLCRMHFGPILEIRFDDTSAEVKMGLIRHY
jgi:hypothetical protein